MPLLPEVLLVQIQTWFDLVWFGMCGWRGLRAVCPLPIRMRGLGAGCPLPEAVVVEGARQNLLGVSVM